MHGHQLEAGSAPAAKPDMLIIAPTYAYFVKDQVETLAPRFGKVSAVVTHNPIADLSGFLPVESLKPFAWKAKVDLRGKPGNVEVSGAVTLYLPTDGMYKKLPARCLRAVDRVLEKRMIHADISHSHFVSPQGYAGVRLKEKYGIPSIVTAHGYDVYDLPYRSEEWRELVASTLDAADHVITVSHSNLRHLERLRVKAPVSVIPNGFRDDLFYPADQALCRKKLGLPEDRQVIVTVGSLSRVKGHEFLVRAMRTLADHGSDVLCVIVGQGGLRAGLEGLIRELRLDGRVLLAGARPHSEIPLWLNAADLFVLPSLAEGNPTVMFECLGCGRPFVGTAVGGVPEHITSEDIGYVVEAGDPGRLAEAIGAALGKAWDRVRIYEYSRQYTWEHIVGQYCRIYGRFLGPGWRG